ncbi:MAG: hypothetical protein U9O83_07195 [Campylobacterota bacterium]|nr:hypothetical protein [Campylobacterota bacterium]
MVEEQKKEETPKEKMEKLKKDVSKKTKKNTQAAIHQVATRDKLERDYKEDLLEVEFYSSSETKRMVKAKRPTQEEMMTIMRLSAEASIYEGKMDSKSLQRMVDIYDKLPQLAATLTVDNNLDGKFWKKNVSFNTLQGFITELIRVTQQGPMSGDEMESFR